MKRRPNGRRFLYLEEPADQIKYAKTNSHDHGKCKQYQSRYDELEFLVPVRIRWR